MTIEANGPAPTTLDDLWAEYDLDIEVDAGVETILQRRRAIERAIREEATAALDERWGRIMAAYSSKWRTRAEAAEGALRAIVNSPWSFGNWQRLRSIAAHALAPTPTDGGDQPS